MEVANSQLAAALLAAPCPREPEPGPSSRIDHPIIEVPVTNLIIPKTEPIHHEEEKEEPPSHDEFSDTESDNIPGNKATPGRNVTLQMLLDSKILAPGEAAMTIEYLGQKFVGDLRADGKIKSHETETIFCNPSAWAIHCKRIINPEKKSGCGWASVKYKGRKLDSFKAAWLRKQSQQRDANAAADEDILEPEIEIKIEPPPRRIVTQHNTIPNKMVLHDSNTLVEAISFPSIGKMQPFHITMSSNACLVMDMHCHLMLTEVRGYLAGIWDVNNQTAHITHAYPCLTSKIDKKPKVLVEAEIQSDIEKNGLSVIGWYHSHPTNPAMPSLRDCDNQLDYQIRMKGPTEATYTPCVGLIISPYNPESPVSESSMTCFWVMPPPEIRPNEYPRPFMMQYSLVHDYYLTKHVVERIENSIKYYTAMKDAKTVSFFDEYKPDITYLDKLKCTLQAKFPKEKSETLVWNFIKFAVGCNSDIDGKVDLESLLSVPKMIARPKTPQVPLIPNIPSISTLQQMVSMPVGIPPMNPMPKFEMPTPLNIPIPPKAAKSSASSSLNLPSGLDVLTSMTMGLGGNHMSMGLTPGLDALTASSLLANLQPGLSGYTGGKASDPTSFAASLAKISGSSSHKMMPSTSSSLADSLQSVNLPSNIPSSLSSNLMLSSADLANALFQTGKFPSTSSLLGIPDPLSKSTLAANNMFLSPSLLKMQEALLKPLTSNSTSYKSIIDQNLHSKSSHDILKNIKDFLPPDINLTASKGKQDTSHSDSYMKPPDISISPVSGMKRPRVPDFSDFALPSSKTSSPLLSQVLDHSHSRRSKSRTIDRHIFEAPSPIKIPRSDDYSSLNLSLHSAMNLAANSSKDPTYQSLSSLKRVSESYLNDLAGHDAYPADLSARSNNSKERKSMESK